MKRYKAYPEAKHGHDHPFLETPSLRLTHSISHFNKQRKDSGSLGAHQEMGICVWKERRDGLFIGKDHHQLLVKATDVRQP
jgi:hypothetical protein